MHGTPLPCGFIGFLPRATQLWNALPAPVFLGRYDRGIFKKLFTSTLMASNAPVVPLVLHGVAGGGDHLPCLFFFHKKNYVLIHSIYSRVFFSLSTIFSRHYCGALKIEPPIIVFTVGYCAAVLE